MNESSSEVDYARSERMELYKLMVEMADRVSQRRQSSNSFYLSINTLLFSGSAYIGMSDSSVNQILAIGISGILISWLWMRSIESYRNLNAAKFKIINELEANFSYSPFTREWQELDPDGDGVRHRPFHTVEKLVPRVFILIYILHSLFLAPWSGVISLFYSSTPR